MVAPNDNQITVHVVVSGEDLFVQVNLHNGVDQLVRRALDESGNRGQDPSGWVLKTAAGTPIDQNQTVAQAGISGGEKLFLTPKQGAGG
jgi:hypothetical protein